MIVLRAGTYFQPDPVVLGAQDSGLTIQSYDGETAWLSGAKKLAPAWKPFNTSGQPLFVADLAGQIAELGGSIPGLRVNGLRAVRARYPNFDPEVGFGSDLSAAGYLPTTPDPPLTAVLPPWPYKNTTAYGYHQFVLGIGGACKDFTPQAGYWCGNHTQGGGGRRYGGVPGGILFDRSILPHSPYQNATGAVVQMWRPKHWSSWMFEVGAFNESSFVFAKGGFQGARGPGASGGQFYVENLFEEWDNPNEYYFDEATQKLYYFHNASAGPSIAASTFEAVGSTDLLRISGNMSQPAMNISIRGLGFRDTAYTYLHPHEMPSGGDWSLQRSGALFMEGTVGTVVDACNFSRLDSNAIMISGFNRNTTISRNEIAWTGDNAIAAWGKTRIPAADCPECAARAPGFGFDGTEGTQPRGTKIVDNLVHELGIFEKQSSLFFQAKSCQNTIKGNIFYNGPRAGIK